MSLNAASAFWLLTLPWSYPLESIFLLNICMITCLTCLGWLVVRLMRTFPHWREFLIWYRQAPMEFPDSADASLIVSRSVDPQPIENYDDDIDYVDGPPLRVATAMALWRKSRYGIPGSRAEEMVAREQMYKWATALRDPDNPARVSWRESQVVRALPYAVALCRTLTPEERELAEHVQSNAYITSKLVGWRHQLALLIPFLARFLEQEPPSY